YTTGPARYRSITLRKSCSLVPNAAYRLGRLIPIAFVKSGIVVPSYPCRQNTSSARSRASSRSNSRGRPMVDPSEKNPGGRGRRPHGYCTLRYTTFRKGDGHVRQAERQGRGGHRGVERDRRPDRKTPGRGGGIRGRQLREQQARGRPRSC